MRPLLLSFKTRGRRSLARVFASLLADGLARHFPDLPVVPVPGRAAVRRRRGWEHVEEIARELEARHRVTVVRALERSRGPAQKRLGRQQRLNSLRGQIRLRPVRRIRRCLPGRDLVLVDDLMTTGATLEECARVLKSAGCARVFALTLAWD
jgi:ComF family protein